MLPQKELDDLSYKYVVNGIMSCVVVVVVVVVVVHFPCGFLSDLL